MPKITILYKENNSPFYAQFYSQGEKNKKIKESVKSTGTS